MDELIAEVGGRADEIRATLPSAGHEDFEDTLYIGGGTPSVLPLCELTRLVRAVGEAIYGDPRHEYSEFTVEVNPEDIVEKGIAYVASLRDLGVNRISMGVQSFDDGILRWMNRRHDSAGAVKAVEIIRSAGIGNVSIDLIFGIAGLTENMWESTIDKALSLHPEHISAYQLSVEPESMLARKNYAELSEDECRAQYDLLCGRLHSAGYHHYEVSNFARPGYEARHNSAYWRRVPYAGLGAGAHSALLDAGGEVRVRKWNSESDGGYVSEGEILNDEDVRVEEIMLALRTDKGIDLCRLPADAVSRLVAEGALEYFGAHNVRIREDHLFVSDEIIGELA